LSRLWDCKEVILLLVNHHNKVSVLQHLGNEQSQFCNP
jgi:hypothetical protein